MRVIIQAQAPGQLFNLGSFPAAGIIVKRGLGTHTIRPTLSGRHLRLYVGSSGKEPLVGSRSYPLHNHN